ncbi:tetratricopeptide repeat protein [Maioricimonas rarisocia]|uniref:Tetratricopeptide repeat protein n=1 Tax=Maioricimonas rarisocia TaxID=2528026 RepID=A0A517ZAZ1_9PLAN|nr:tetratricopeptide repeat protein [Maioricimonas rarisocia]
MPAWQTEPDAEPFRENGLSRVSVAVLVTGAALVAWGAGRYVLTQFASSPGLVAIPQPSLERLPEGVRQQLIETRAASDRVLEESGDSSALLEARAYGELGKVYAAYEFYDEASACFVNASRLQPQEYRWPYLMAYSLARNGSQQQKRTAVALFETALDLMHRDMSADPRQISSARLRLGESLRELAQRERAREQFARILELNSDHSEALLALGQMASQDGRSEEAVGYLERAIATAPSYKDATALLAAEYARLGDRDRAAELQARAESIEGRGNRIVDPVLSEMRALNRSAAALNRKARSLLRAGQTRRAITVLRQVLAIDPENATAQLNMGDLLIRAGRIDEGQALYRKVIAAGDGAELARRKLGYSLLAAGQPAEAVDEYRRVLLTSPNDARARYFAGAALSLLGRHEEALSEFEAVCAAESDHIGARVGRARMNYALGRYREARETLESDLAAGLTATPIQVTLARILAACPDEDVRDGPRALELARPLFQDQQSVVYAESLAMAYAETGEFDRAVDTQQWALERVRSAPGASRLVPHVELRGESYRQQKPCRIPWSDAERFPSFASPLSRNDEESGAEPPSE